MRSPALLSVAAALTLAMGSAQAQPIVVATEAERYQYKLCTLIESAAEHHRIPVGFFTRLIWKESRFRSDAVSPKGAQGIAQFMPGTAEERGLADPFDPGAAIPASAHLLADLDRRFGNLGLAAAAYNAGADRVRGWLANGSSLPYETQDYVLAITGVPADIWASDGAEDVPEPEGEGDCLVLAAKLEKPGAELSPEIETAEAPWGVQVAGNFSKARAIASYAALQKRFPALLADRPPMVVAGRMQGRGPRTFYRIRVPAQTREEGEAFCEELVEAGGSCVVLRS